LANLKVYNASAGSGKTFKLTEEYLLLIFKNYQQKKYRNILAVTFTNKATEEMKTRIISEIYKLSIGKISGYENLLKQTYHFTNDDLKIAAKFVLTSILHDYSRFNISTIDSFFQLIIRAFTREIGLQAAFNVELNDHKILEKSVDLLFNTLDENNELLKWLIEFSDIKIQDGKSWNLKNDIISLSTEIFNESFKSITPELLDKIQNKNFIKEYYDKLALIEKNFKSTLSEYAKQAIDLIEKSGLSKDDFKGKKNGFTNYFYKIYEKQDFKPTQTVLNAVNNIENWYTKDSEKIVEISEIYHNGLNQKLIQIIDIYNSQSVNYNSAKAIKKNLFTLAIIVDVNRKVREYVSENNLFLLSDAAKLLNQVISGSDTPFVYEKIGNTYKNFMIDEFQDTSTIQWGNFKNLISNSLSEGNNCLLVGDIKQSIYRWRNSDWNLLANQVQYDFATNFEKQNLSHNWRSNKNIILFNNHFFANASNILQNAYNAQNNLNDNTINSAYENIVQKIPEQNINSAGYINFTFLEGENSLWKAKVDEKIPELINNLLEKNYKQKEITILVRNRSEGNRIVDVLLGANNSDKFPHKFKIISDESLYIKNSVSVRLMLALLRYMQNTNDNFYRVLMISEYLKYVKNNTVLFESSMQKINDKSSIESILPPDFILQQNDLLKLPLYDLVEKLILIFDLKSIGRETPFVITFQGIVFDYVNSEKSDINSFLKWWEEQGSLATIKASESQDAIRILTIHKSKGLEFDVVLIPYLDWTLNQRHTHILWCETDVEPFNEINKLPIFYTSDLVDTIFSKYYFDEQQKSFVDNLNLMYVAFTRAKEQLFAFLPIKKKIEDIKSTSDIAWSVVNQHSDFSQFWNKQENIFEFGEIPDKKTKQIEENSELQLSIFNSNINIYDKLRLKFNSLEINSFTNPEMKFGNEMHYLFQNIKYADDIVTAVRRMIHEGKISKNKESEIIKELETEFKNEPIKSWFDNSWEVLNERSILLKNGDIRRPDRVIVKDNQAICIDYKFGITERKSYINQLNDYISFLKSMGYKNTKAYIWYYSLKKIVEV